MLAVRSTGREMCITCTHYDNGFVMPWRSLFYVYSYRDMQRSPYMHLGLYTCYKQNMPTSVNTQHCKHIYVFCFILHAMPPPPFFFLNKPHIRCWLLAVVTWDVCVSSQTHVSSPLQVKSPPGALNPSDVHGNKAISTNTYVFLFLYYRATSNI